MFLTTLLSDAAAQHGHEFSAPRPSTPSRISPIPRMMRPQSALARTRQPCPARPDGNSLSIEPAAVAAKPEKVMFKEEAEVKIVEGHRRSMSESSEEETSIAARSAAGPARNTVEVATLKKKRQSRLKTSYTFAHAAAKSHAFHKLRSRPPAVLQLQQVSAGARPKPAFEVYPSGRYAKKLGRELARLHKGKDKLGTEDVVVCKAHEYDAFEDDWDSQEVIGIVCASCKDESHASGNAQLCLEDGSAWEAIAHARGRYDFVSTDSCGHRRVIRWVPRRVQGRRRAASVASGLTAPPSPSEELVYRFSTIDPSCRRHPVIATMTSTSLEISNTYFMPIASAEKHGDDHQPNEAISRSSQADSPAVKSSLIHREVLETTPLLRSLILLSGVYVALRNNWSPVFSYKKELSKPTEGVKPLSRSNSVRSNNASPSPSTDGFIPGPSRRHTFNFSRSFSMVGQIPGGSMSQALNGSFSDASATSRSTTPESRHRRGDTLWTELMRSATDRVPTNGIEARNPSNATFSTDSAFTEGSEYSRQCDSLISTPRTPTPSSRPSDENTPNDYFQPPSRAPTASSSFMQRTSSLRKHWRISSGSSTIRINTVDVDAATTTTTGSVNNASSTGTPTSANPTDDSGSVPVSRFSFARGRSTARSDKSPQVTDGRAPPPVAFHNHHHNNSNNHNQWWIDWGSNARTSTSTARPSDVGATTTTAAAATANGEIIADANLLSPRHPEKTESPSRPATAIHPHRRSFSIQSWRKREPSDRPKSMLVGGGDAAAVAVQNLRREKTGTSLFRRVTHRLRREERRLG